MSSAINHSFISAHFLLSTYFLTAQTYECMHLIVQVYGDFDVCYTCRTGIVKVQATFMDVNHCSSACNHNFSFDTNHFADTLDISGRFAEQFYKDCIMYIYSYFRNQLNIIGQTQQPTLV